ncbi:MAG: TSUP family transporter [Candidatus Lokiarchaeota archaeon]|nr:TSUP family transporter [Candidatus Lokiarchaeota archaeon]
MQTLAEPTVALLLVLLFLGFIGGFIDNLFGMGYSLLAPVLIFMGLNPLVVVPTLLLSQTAAGLSGTIFHRFFKNIEFSSPDQREAKTYLLFTSFGIIGAVISAIIAITLPDWFMLTYIGIMMVAVGFMVKRKVSFVGRWREMYLASAVGGFNKAISGGGYGPIITSVQIMSGSKARKSVGITQFSESTISAIGFLIYVALEGPFALLEVSQSLTILIITGVVAAPLGALLVTRLHDHIAENVIGTAAIALGIFTLVRLLIIWM